MDNYAIAGVKKEQIHYLYAPSHLNRTSDYGVSFERGTYVDYADRRQVFISGTASINNKGEVMYPNCSQRQTAPSTKSVRWWSICVIRPITTSSRRCLRSASLASPMSSSMLLLLATATIATARSIPTINAERAREAAHEQVWWNDRVCPLATLAHDFLESVYGQSTYKGLSAVQVVYGWRLRPDVWKDEAMIYVADADLRRQLHLEGEYATFSELFDDTLGYRLNTIGSELPERMQQIVRESQPVIELDEKVGLIIELTQGRLIQPRPDSIPPVSKWRIEAEIFYVDTPTWIIALLAICIILFIFLAKKFCLSKK